MQELPAIEGLARVDVICLDKTGTLTEPGMRVSEVLVLDDAAPVDEVLAAMAAAEDHPNPSLEAIRDRYPEAPGWAVAAAVPFSSARKWSGVELRVGGQLGPRVPPRSCWPRLTPRWSGRRRWRSRGCGCSSSRARRGP